MLLKFKDVPVPGNLLVGYAFEVPEGFASIQHNGLYHQIYRVVSGIEKDTITAEVLWEFTSSNDPNNIIGADVVQKAKPLEE